MSFEPPLPVPKDQAGVSLLTYEQLAEHVRLARANVEAYSDVLPLLRGELEARTPERNYRCMKCGHSQFDPHEVRAASGSLSSFFGVEPATYRALVCHRCKFTEFYQGDTHIAQQVLDFLVGG